LDAQQNPALAGVVGYRLEEQIMGNAVEESSDVKINNPVLLPTALPSLG
jgi:hypothetical protein